METKAFLTNIYLHARSYGDGENFIVVDFYYCIPCVGEKFLHTHINEEKKYLIDRLSLTEWFETKVDEKEIRDTVNKLILEGEFMMKQLGIEYVKGNHLHNSEKTLPYDLLKQIALHKFVPEFIDED